MINFAAALILGLFFKGLITSSLYFPTKTGSTVPNCHKLRIRLVLGIARISILEKQNVDCVTEKRNILKSDHDQLSCFFCIANHVTSTGHNLKWDHFDILEKSQSDTHCKIKETTKTNLNDNVNSEKLSSSLLLCIFHMQILLSFCHRYC